MFDELDNKNSQNTTSPPPLVRGETIASRPVAPVPPASTGRAEDIFAQVDQGDRLAVFKPKAADAKLPPSTVIPEEETWQKNKVLIFGLIFGGLLVVVVGGYFGLKLAIKSVPTTKETAVQEEAKNNQAKTETPNSTEQPPAQETNAPLSQPIEPPQVTQPVDTDQDGLTDEEEAKLGINPNDPDTDHDGLTDREEVKVYKTDPLNPDTDGDGYQDGAEVKNGYNPKGAGKLLDLNQ